MELFLGTLMMWGFGAPIYLPWIFARFGAYKRWYLAPFAPPIMWSRAIYRWPASAFFICTPLIAFLGIKGDEALNISAIVGVVGVVLAIIMVLWTPGWAKPGWQRYLEDNYPWWEIRRVFIPAWRKMDRAYWNKLMNSEGGIEELVRMARETTADGERNG